MEIVEIGEDGWDSKDNRWWWFDCLKLFVIVSHIAKRDGIHSLGNLGSMSCAAIEWIFITNGQSYSNKRLRCK